MLYKGFGVENILHTSEPQDQYQKHLALRITRRRTQFHFQEEKKDRFCRFKYIFFLVNFFNEQNVYNILNYTLVYLDDCGHIHHKPYMVLSIYVAVQYEIEYVFNHFSAIGFLFWPILSFV